MRNQLQHHHSFVQPAWRLRDILRQKKHQFTKATYCIQEKQISQMLVQHTTNPNQQQQHGIYIPDAEISLQDTCQLWGSSDLCHVLAWLATERNWQAQQTIALARFAHNIVCILTTTFTSLSSCNKQVSSSDHSNLKHTIIAVH